jgi:hypothetical protein
MQIELGKQQVQFSENTNASSGFENQAQFWLTRIGLEPFRVYVIEFSLKLLCLHPVFGPPFTPYPLFEWGPQSKEVLFNFGTNSAFNAQDSR